MSYRAFKRLLGESSLERKCRFLLGAGILVLITASFWLYARQTEHLAYDQMTNTGRLLVQSILKEMHATPASRAALRDFQRHAEETWPQALDGYNYKLIKPLAREPQNQAAPDELALIKRFLGEPDKAEESRTLHAQQVFQYYGAVRARNSCFTAGCHGRTPEERDELGERQREGGLMAVVRINVPVRAIENEVHINRALLISTALLTALLIMAGSYLIIRYVIVKPLKHLKEVSDTIAAGELNVRSEIQTGDEFEDLSHAFNRMLRNLVSVQDRLKKVNADLDRKVDELARLNLTLYESNRLKGDFLATMSHELRTPLNSVLGFSDVLLSADGLTEKQKRWVGNIRTSGQHLLGMINEILDLAKMEAGKMQVRPERFEIAEVTDGVLAMFRPLAERKDIDLKAQLADDLPPVRQDAGKLRRVLENLLSNAIKFTPDGGRVVLKGESDGQWVSLTVTDTGVGIAPEDQEAVFEKFRQAANPMTREYAGTGLGLSIVRELVNLLQGEVSLASELGKGSSFTVRLPVALTEAPAVPGEDGASADEARVAAFRTAVADLAAAPAPGGG